MQLLCFGLMLPPILAAAAALAADADNGKRLAEMRCIPCHVVSPNQRRDVPMLRRLKSSRENLHPAQKRLRFRYLIRTPG